MKGGRWRGAFAFSSSFRSPPLAPRLQLCAGPGVQYHTAGRVFNASTCKDDDVRLGCAAEEHEQGTWRGGQQNNIVVGRARRGAGGSEWDWDRCCDPYERALQVFNKAGGLFRRCV